MLIQISRVTSEVQEKVLTKYSSFMIIVLVISGCVSTSVVDQYPRTDGVYRVQVQSTKFGPAYDYLRFYKNSQIVSADIIGSPQAFWLATLKNFRGKGVGDYTVSGGKLSFTTRDEYAVVAYTGKVLENGDLNLFSRSQTTGYKDHKVYRFVKIDENRLPARVRLRGLKLQPDGKVKPVDVGD